jgi:hypothetical protein
MDAVDRHDFNLTGLFSQAIFDAHGVRDSPSGDALRFGTNRAPFQRRATPATRSKLVGHKFFERVVRHEVEIKIKQPGENLLSCF